jgi:hypothetical protein
MMTMMMMTHPYTGMYLTSMHSIVDRHICFRSPAAIVRVSQLLRAVGRVYIALPVSFACPARPIHECRRPRPISDAHSQYLPFPSAR